MMFRLVGRPAQSLMQAQGRFGVLMKLNLFGAAAFVTLVACAAQMGAEVAVASAVSIYFALEAFAFRYIALDSNRTSVGDVLGVFALPTAIAGVGAVLAIAVASVTPASMFRDWIMIFVLVVVCLGVYAGGVRLLANPLWEQLMSLARGFGDGNHARINPEISGRCQCIVMRRQGRSDTSHCISVWGLTGCGLRRLKTAGETAMTRLFPLLTWS